MRVFNSWLVANLEVMTYVVMTVLIYKILEAYPESFLSTNGYPHFLTAIVLGFGVLFLGAPTTSFFGDIWGVVLSFIGSVGVFIEFGYSLRAYIPCLVVGAVFGIFVATFSWRNFYDVVSLRWLYVNSDAAIFEANALYSFSRFRAAFNFAVFLYVFITVLFAA